MTRKLDCGMEYDIGRSLPHASAFPLIRTESDKMVIPSSRLPVYIEVSDIDAPASPKLWKTSRKLWKTSLTNHQENTNLPGDHLSITKRNKGTPLRITSSQYEICYLAQCKQWSQSWYPCYGPQDGSCIILGESKAGIQ